jgi:hypothetical protein
MTLTVFDPTRGRMVTIEVPLPRKPVSVQN